MSFRSAEAIASGHGAVRRRLLPELPVDVFTEVRLPSREWALVVQGNGTSPDRDLVVAAGVTCRIRHGRLEVVSGPETDRAIFCILLADLVERLESPGPARTATLVRRLESWRRMLGRGFPGVLGIEARFGLFGELLVLREIILPALGPAAVGAWLGPDGAPRDFQHQDTAVEVKAVGPRNPDLCRIRNERQLDATGLSNLFLVHHVIGQSTSGSTLGELLDELRSHSDVHADLAEFENRLLELGWFDSHRSQYPERFVMARRRCYRVAGDFPRITSGDTPPGVSRVSYLVDLSACEQHLVDVALVRGAFSQGVGGVLEQ
ncbi:PD-(D/E)XK motif protein [Actinomadura sp. 21ATH]|uniref:PD-(D/E)XK motif protein n=1 Tax=Actinomadura sp. 21ATH TaxID=1735444 RepID=UPI0035BEE79B